MFGGTIKNTKQHLRWTEMAYEWGETGWVNCTGKNLVAKFQLDIAHFNPIHLLISWWCHHTRFRRVYWHGKHYDWSKTDHGCKHKFGEQLCLLNSWFQKGAEINSHGLLYVHQSTIYRLGCSCMIHYTQSFVPSFVIVSQSDSSLPGRFCIFCLD